MRELGAGRQRLSDPVVRYSYPNSRNAAGDPDSPRLCPDGGDEVPANAARRSVLATHVQMMGNSDNIATRALELRYGRGALNRFAVRLGMADTRLDQIIGCGFDGGHRNATTLADLGRLYGSVAGGALGPPGAERQFRRLMDADAYDLGPVVRAEAARLGAGAAADRFLARTHMVSKGGSYTLCEATCTPHTTIVTEAGLLTVPVRTRRGRVRPRKFTFGAFIDRVRVDCLPCAADDAQYQAVGRSVPEVLRPAIRRALRTWRPR